MSLNEQASKLDVKAITDLMIHPENAMGESLDFISRLVRNKKNGRWYVLHHHVQGERTCIVTDVCGELPTPALVECAEDLERWGRCRACGRTVREFDTMRQTVEHFSTCMLMADGGGYSCAAEGII